MCIRDRDDETAVGKEGHVGMAAAYASYLLLYEEGAFHRLEILQACLLYTSRCV